MKSVLITFDQAYYERIMALLDRLGCRGFTYLEKVQGRGSKTGDPHFGSHTPQRPPRAFLPGFLKRNVRRSQTASIGNYSL